MTNVQKCLHEQIFMKQLFILLLVFISTLTRGQQPNSKEDKWCQYLVASQIYIAQESNLEPLIMERAEKVRDEANAANNKLWAARANFTLGIYAIQYRRIGLADQYLKAAVESYKSAKAESPTGTPALSREKQLADLVLAKLYAAVPSGDAAQMDTAKKDMEQKQKKYGQGKETVLSFIAQLFEANLKIKEMQRPIKDNDIEKQELDSLRALGFYAIKFRADKEQAKKWMLYVRQWYYDHKVKSPETHAFEAWFEDFPESSYATIPLTASTYRSSIKTVDKEGNFLWFVSDTMYKNSQPLANFAERPTSGEIMNQLYPCLIHPQDTGWMLFHLDEPINQAYIGFKDQTAAGIPYYNKVQKEHSPIVSKDRKISVDDKILTHDKILISGNIAAAMTVLAYPYNINSAMMPLPAMNDFKDKLKEMYRHLDTNWVLNNPDINNSTQMALLTETKNLKILYPTEASFVTEFEKFDYFVRDLQARYKSQRFKPQILLSRRGYQSIYLGALKPSGRKNDSPIEWENHPLELRTSLKQNKFWLFRLFAGKLKIISNLTQVSNLRQVNFF
jgi:hypothetical protein